MKTIYKDWTITELKPEFGSYCYRNGYTHTISNGMHTEYAFGLEGAKALIDFKGVMISLIEDSTQ